MRLIKSPKVKDRMNEGLSKACEGMEIRVRWYCDEDSALGWTWLEYIYMAQKRRNRKTEDPNKGASYRSERVSDIRAGEAKNYKL